MVNDGCSSLQLRHVAKGVAVAVAFEVPRDFQRLSELPELPECLTPQYHIITQAFACPIVPSDSKKMDVRGEKGGPA